MTESEWLACDRPDDMLQAARPLLTDRKLLLFACGCCRLPRSPLPDLSQTADLIEHILDTHKRTAGAQAIFDTITKALQGNIAGVIAQTLSMTAQGTWLLARQLGQMCRVVEVRDELGDVIGTLTADHHSGQADLVRELLGDPFRPVDFDPRWRTETVINLATGIEAEKAWDRLPILADALQDTGCEEPRVLDHCREKANHVRGCWVLDLCLGHAPVL